MSRRFCYRAGVLYAALAIMGPAASAHHSYSMFDTSRQLQVSGAVRVLEWGNPHVWLWVTVTDKQGTPALYAFEGTSPGEMSRRSGWTKSIVSSGDTVIVIYTPFKDGKNGGHIKSVTLPNGRKLDASPGPPPPTPQEGQGKP
jgi:hypothetical protein